jgi:hypothetical protein
LRIMTWMGLSWLRQLCLIQEMSCMFYHFSEVKLSHCFTGCNAPTPSIMF